MKPIPLHPFTPINWIKSKGIATQHKLIVPLLILATALRFFQLGEESLWGDEFASLRAIEDLDHYFFVNRVLYFLILKGWSTFGDSEFWLRVPSAFFGIASVGLVYQLGYKLFDRTIGLTAAIFLTLSPLAIFHSQEVRMYMLSVFVCLAGTLSLTYFILNKKPRFFFFWFTLRFLAILTTPINILMLAPDIFILGWHFCKRYKFWFRSKLLFVIIPSIFILSFLFFLVFYPSIDSLLEFVEVRQDAPVNLTLISFIGGIARLTVWPLSSPFQNLAWFYDHFFNLYAIGLIFLIFTSFFSKQVPSHKFMIALWGLMTLGILYIACASLAPVLWGVPRYSVFAAPYIFILLALGIVRIWKWQRRVAMFLIAMYFFAVGGSLWHYYTTDTDEDWRSVFQVVHQYEQPNDVLVVFPPEAKEGLDYYYKGSSPVYFIDNPGIYPSESAINTTLNGFFNGGDFKLQVKPSSKAWFILRYAHSGIDANDRQIFTQRIQENFNIASHYQFSGIEVILANPKDSLELTEPVK
jgi:hypothetical protein